MENIGIFFIQDNFLTPFPISEKNLIYTWGIEKNNNIGTGIEMSVTLNTDCFELTNIFFIKI